MTATTQKQSVRENAAAPVQLDFARALLSGLRSERRSIPCRFLYDARGSELFEQITELPEYYPTRTEAQILRDCSGELASRIPAESIVIEFGSGSSTKTEILLRALDAPSAYVPIDISPNALDEACERLRERFPDLTVEPVVGDFSKPIALPASTKGRARLGFFPGSTLGNLVRDDAQSLLESMRRTLGGGSRLVIGIDLKKDRDRLIAAYNDSQGVTAAFNLNVLSHANAALGTDFETSQFAHEATYDEDAGRIDMYLVSTADQVVNVLGHQFRFKNGDRIHTEHSHKYDINGFMDLARDAGWTPVTHWTDREDLFSVHELET